MELRNLEELEREFSLQFVRFVNAFNYLERNIGLCLSFLLNPQNPRSTYSRLLMLTTEGKLAALRSELSKRYGAGDNVVLSEFEAWYERAEKSRALRDKYVHGQWQILPMDKERPVTFSLPEWIGGGDHSMSLAEFETAVQEVEGVFNRFMDFRKKYSI